MIADSLLTCQGWQDIGDQTKDHGEPSNPKPNSQPKPNPSQNAAVNKDKIKESLRLYGQKLYMPPLLAPNVRVKHGGLQTFIPREHDSCSRCVQDECKKSLCHVTRYGRELKRTKGEDVVEGRKRVEQKGCER